MGNYIKKEVQEQADSEIKRLQESLSCILAENTNDGFKQFIVDGAGNYIVNFKGERLVTTKVFYLAYDNYKNL